MLADNYLAKFKKITDNTDNVTFIVTAIILFTFIIFILIVYNFLSKSSTNCNNIDKAYDAIYSIDDANNIGESHRTLYKPQSDRIIDISFSFNIYVIKNLKLISYADKDTVFNAGTTITDPLNIGDINITPLTSSVIKKNLTYLNDFRLVNADNILDNDTFTDIFTDKTLTINNDGYIYYKLSCTNTFLNDGVSVESGGGTITLTDIDNDDHSLIKKLRLDSYKFYYLYDTTNKPTGIISTDDNVSILAISIKAPYHIYISEKFVKMQQNSLKYTYSTKPDNIHNVVLSRDIELLNNRGNIEKVLNKIHNNFILTAFNCCNSGEYQNNYVDTCILKKCLNLGIKCLDFQIFNYNQKPIIASSTMDSLYIKETFNYLELDPVLDIITNYINGDNSNTSPLFLHFRVMSLSEKIYKQLIRSILKKLGQDQEQQSVKSFKLVSGFDNINNISLHDLNSTIVVFINPYYTANNYLINQLDNYINEVKKDLSIVNNYKIYKSGNILNSNSDLILFKNDNYDIYKDSHNKSKPTLVIPELNTKNNDESFVKYMQHNITFISMKFQEVDNFLQVAIYIFTKYENNSGFLLKNSIDSSIFEINIQPDSVTMLENTIDADSLTV
jgi:hypothetical protein